jgi:hypothetical protein
MELNRLDLIIKGIGKKTMTSWSEIIAECPKLYRNGMNFECGIGWANIINDLSLKIEDILNKKPSENRIFAIQVKEKYGTLRFYMSKDTEEIIDLITDAEALSSQTCESCGAPAKMRGARWVEVKCDQCYPETK